MKEQSKRNNQKERLEEIKSMYHHWESKSSPRGTDCSDIGSDCHGDGECGGDGE